MDIPIRIKSSFFYFIYIYVIGEIRLLSKFDYCTIHVCPDVYMERVQKCRYVCVIVYKSGLARCGDNLYKPITLNFPLFAYLYPGNWSTRTLVT